MSAPTKVIFLSALEGLKSIVDYFSDNEIKEIESVIYGTIYGKSEVPVLEEVKIEFSIRAWI